VLFTSLSVAHFPFPIFPFVFAYCLLTLDFSFWHSPKDLLLIRTVRRPCFISFVFISCLKRCQQAAARSSSSDKLRAGELIILFEIIPSVYVTGYCPIRCGSTKPPWIIRVHGDTSTWHHICLQKYIGSVWEKVQGKVEKICFTCIPLQRVL